MNSDCVRRAFQVAHFFHVDPRIVLALPFADFFQWEREAWEIVDAQRRTVEDAG